MWKQPGHLLLSGQEARTVKKDKNHHRPKGKEVGRQKKSKDGEWRLLPTNATKNSSGHPATSQGDEQKQNTRSFHTRPGAMRRA